MLELNTMLARVHVADHKCEDALSVLSFTYNIYHRLPQYMYAVWAEELLTQASVQAPSQRGLTRPALMHTDFE